MRATMIVFALTLSLLKPVHAFQSSTVYDGGNGLLEAVNYYHENATSDFAHILEATQRFEAIAADSENWLADYWTALAYSQLALFSRDDRLGPYVELAQLYYQRAWAAKPSEDPKMNADFYALNALILGFVQSADPANASVHAAEERRQWELARTTDPDNPMAFMDRGLSLIRDTRTRAEAYEYLDRAIELYEPRMGTVQPNWGREFIDVWTGSYPRQDNETAGVER